MDRGVREYLTGRQFDIRSAPGTAESLVGQDAHSVPGDRHSLARTGKRPLIERVVSSVWNSPTTRKFAYILIKDA
jgi:hypothetical protein